MHGGCTNALTYLEPLRRSRTHVTVLAYRAFGPTSSHQTVVFLHALGETSDTWTVIGSELSVRGIYCVAADLPGHGRSPRAATYSFDQAAKAVHELLTELDRHDQIFLAGHSLGASVALLVAAQAPGIRGIILEDYALPLGMQQFPVLPPDPPDNFPFDWNAQRDFLDEFRSANPRHLGALDQIRCPVLLLRGSESHVSAEELVRSSEGLSDRSIAAIEGVGHDIHASSPEQWLAQVTRFLDALSH